MKRAYLTINAGVHEQNLKTSEEIDGDLTKTGPKVTGSDDLPVEFVNLKG